jgi:hypothetical protein
VFKNQEKSWLLGWLVGAGKYCLKLILKLANSHFNKKACRQFKSWQCQ